MCPCMCMRGARACGGAYVPSVHECVCVCACVRARACTCVHVRACVCESIYMNFLLFLSLLSP